MSGENRDMHGDKIPAPGSKDYLIRIIERSTQDLHERVNMQQTVLLTILGKIKDLTHLDLCQGSDCSHRRLLHKVLMETIEVLEETKRSFKSKRLEELRKRLMEVIKEAA